MAPSSDVWLYVAVACALLTAVTVPLAAGARAVATSFTARQRERPVQLDPGQRELIERFY